MTPAVRVLMLLAALAAIQAGGAGARAAQPEPARALFEQAEVKFNLGNFEQAAADYQAAYELDHRPALLFNVGQCYRNLGDYERARFFYLRYLTLDPRTPNRRETERLVATMSRSLEEQGKRTEAGAPVLPAALAVGEPAAPGATAPPRFAPALDSTAPHASARPIYRRPWFWVGVGGALAGAVAAGLLLSSGDEPRGSLPSIDARAGRAAKP